MQRTLFDKQAENQQRKWRQENQILWGQNGFQNRVSKDYILPSSQWLLGIWQDIREPLVNYLEVEGVQANKGKHNLKSSWSHCANIFFPFRLNPDMKAMLSSFLSRELKLEISAISGLELEYAAPGRLAPEYLLGESKGMRGSGQTSPDVAILFKCPANRCGLYLLENKYTEHYFYECSAAKKTISKAHSLSGLKPNHDPGRCKDTKALLENPAGSCHQAAWKRRYWEILLDHVDPANFLKSPYCPAMVNGYQLFRQQALAQGILDSRLFDYVISGVAYDERNNELTECLSDIGIADFVRDWGNIFSNNSRVIFHCFSHQKLVSWITRSQSLYVTKWGKYLRERYAF